jgi:16S rRNA (cytidine1402-2'-O)-methyltransferase
MAELLGARAAAVARELTKLHETITRGTLDRLATEFSEGSALKGELVVVIAPPIEDSAGISDEKIVEQLGKALNLESFRDAVRSVSEVLQVPRSRVYELGLSLKPKAD